MIKNSVIYINRMGNGILGLLDRKGVFVLFSGSFTPRMHKKHTFTPFVSVRKGAFHILEKEGGRGGES